MNQYSLDIERLYESFDKQGKTLKGLACLQYPVYCIHAEIIDTTPDPFSNLDRVISEFYFENPEFSTLQIANLIGTPKKFVEQRIATLFSDGLLEKGDSGIQLTSHGTKVFKEAIQEREYNRSYDFYIDGITFKPLKRNFYISNRNKLISEKDFHYYTDYNGNLKTTQLFGPDIVYTPLDSVKVEFEILSIDKGDRNDFQIPTGLKAFTNITFTRQTFPVLVAISTTGENVIKEVIDGYPYHTELETETYYEAAKTNVISFHENLSKRIQYLEFRIDSNPRSTFAKDQLTSNWNEIDRTDCSPNRCYGFSSEDLLMLIENSFNLSGEKLEDVINEDREVKVMINRTILQKTEDKQKLIRSVKRQRDYLFLKWNRYVFLFYMVFDTEDEFIKQIIRLKESIRKSGYIGVGEIRNIIENDDYFAANYRLLLSEAGEFDLLEKLDVEEFMYKF